MLGGRLLHGGDYNPEQWLECPEVLEEDIRLMKEAGINCVTMGMFSWSVLEPEEGVYDLDWLEERIDRLGEEGIQVILGTPSGGMPHWLTQNYPEVRQVFEDGRRNLAGKRHNFCYTSPVMRKKTFAIDQALSERFGRKENVILWHISNEIGANMGDSTCHCELCQAAFREWLKKKYGTLDNLNRAWWGRFWSHVYTDWDQIHSPVQNGESRTTALELDWKRFSTEQISDFCAMEIRAVHTHSDLPATTNFMDFFKGFDYQRMRKELDLISWDSYPFWHEHRDEVAPAVRAAANHSLMRSLKKQPFLLMESVPSQINWKNVNPLKRPGMHMLSSLQAVAHGSDSVLYFQWRKGRGAFEKFHGAVLDHLNGKHTRTFREVTEVGERLPGLAEILDQTVNAPKAAILFDWENWWAVEDTTGPRLDLDYVECILSHYRAFWEAGIEADFIGMDDELEGYTLVSAPLNYLYKEGYAEKVQRYVDGGGHYVTTYFSGAVDETDLCFTGHHPLEDVLGIVPEEIDAPTEEFANSFVYQGKEYPAVRMCAVVHPKEGTEVLSVYEKDFYAGFPTVTRSRYGSGEAFFIAAESDPDFLRAFYQEMFRNTGLENALGIRLPYGVTVTERVPQNDGDVRDGVVFVMNFGHEPAELTGIGEWTDAETGETVSGVLKMEKLSCKILRKGIK